jgi:hypothetical protein
VLAIAVLIPVLVIVFCAWSISGEQTRVISGER